ncbi:6-O-methylguanine DNA methyltransferase, partial [Protomyces lactucae-debilis]
FRELVYNKVKEIPRGRCTSYGTVAALVGYPRHSRLVGSCLKTCTDETVPWQRVVSSIGIISPREAGPLATQRQAELLRSEGVHVDAIDQGEGFGGDGGKVDMVSYGWY